MPSKLPNLFKPNRSQASLLSSQEATSYHPSPIDSPLHSPAFPPPSNASLQIHDEEDHNFARPYRSDEARFYQVGVPTRSQSQRSPPPNNPHHPTIQLVVPTQDSASSSTIDEDPDSFYQQAPAQTVQKEESKRKRFFGLGSLSSAKELTHNPSALGQRGVGRSISVRKKLPGSEATTDTSNSQKHWPQRLTSATSPAQTSEEEEAQGSPGFDASHLHPNETGPPIPSKEPYKLNQHPPSSQQAYPYNKAPLQGDITDSDDQRTLEQQGQPKGSAWAKAAHLSQGHYRTQSEQQPQYQAFQPSPASSTSTNSHQLPSRGAQEAIQQHFQDTHSSRPPSQQSYESTSSLQTQHRVSDIQQTKQGPPPSPLQTHYRSSDFPQQRLGPPQGFSSPYIIGPMGPPQAQSSQDRRSIESNQQNHPGGLSREGSFQPHSSSIQGHNQPPTTSSAPYGSQLGVGNQATTGYRPPLSSPMAQQSMPEPRSGSPPPSRSRDDLTNLDVSQLLARHDELQDKYRKVKKYYFDKDSQVQQLQNTLAHQRLSQSRTSLDDNEYANRFSRLDSQINNLAFNIRRDWRNVPPWLAPHVNREATTLPTKEMTAVGRACISRWIVDEILERYFHPSLEPSLSSQLKIIEKNLRRFAPATPSDEEKEALVAKISNWRLGTIDGLQEMLSSSQAEDYRVSLTESLAEKLTASLMMNLKEPPPAGLDSGVSMIIELAVGIAANLPLESRDVFVEYILPGTLVNEAYMKVEATLPLLTNPGEGTGTDGNDKSDSASADTNVGDGKDGDGEPVPLKELAGSGQQQLLQKKKGMFGGLMGKKGAGVAGASGEAPSRVQQAQVVQPKEERVRFAAFMAVEVRGRSVLVKAPVYS